MVLMVSMLGKHFSRQLLETLSYFSQKIGFDISCELSPTGDNWHEMLKLFSEKTKKKKKNQNVVSWNLYAEC